MTDLDWLIGGSLSWLPLSGDMERGDFKGGRITGRDIGPPAPGYRGNRGEWREGGKVREGRMGWNDVGRNRRGGVGVGVGWKEK